MSEHDWLTRVGWFLTGNSQAIRDIALTLAAIIGLPLVIWRTWATHQQSKAALRQSQAALEQAKTASQQAETASKRHEQQTDADRQRRITESFARAIEQLGSEEGTVQLGAIYALERIARESPADHWPIMETLAAWVRMTSRVRYQVPRRPLDQLKGILAQFDRGAGATAQAVLTVIGRRQHEHDRKGQIVDLRYTNLDAADLHDAHLAKVKLSGAWLSKAVMAGACLEDADLEGADLRYAKLGHARFNRAMLDGADLRGAELDGAVGLTQEQLNRACGDAETKLPEGLTIPFCDADGRPIEPEH